MPCSRLFRLAAGLLVALLSVHGAAAAAASSAATPVALPAFPGAEGFGALASGGRGGEVYRVTTLDDSGTGSFREGVSQPHRTIVFAVSGVIHLRQNLEISSDLTIAGESAPGEGICVYGAGVSLSRKSNVIIRYLRFRAGIASDRGKKSLSMDHSDHIIVDHCSIEWGRWDDLGITVESHDITVQYCLMAEGIHPQSFGALIDSVTHITLSHNLWMNNESRNPKAKGTIQYINNVVVYNWAITGLCGGHSAAVHSLDVIGNCFIKGPSSNDNFAGQFLATDHVYQKDNLIDLDRDGKLNGRIAENQDFHNTDDATYSLPTFVSKASMQLPIEVTAQPAAEACARVLAEVGCSRHRDQVDRRLIEEVASFGTKGKTLSHLDASGEALAGGLGEYATARAEEDSDRDGIPDKWEQDNGLDPHNPADTNAVEKSGYTHLERYLHERSRDTSR